MIRSRVTTEFWRCFHGLPKRVQRLARRSYGVWIVWDWIGTHEEYNHRY